MGLYFTGDSLMRKSLREGSRSRKGSESVDLLEPQSQPIAVMYEVLCE